MKLLWNAKEAAEALGYSYDYFSRVVRYWPGTPKPLDLPGHARWAAEDWQVWAREHARHAA